MFNRILVPTDFTPKCENALKVAVQIAKKTNSIIDLMHIVETPLILKGNHSDDGPSLSKLAENLIKISDDNLSYFKSKFENDGITINTRTKVDELPDRVAELITQEDYDLIVVGGNTVYQFYETVRKTHPERIVELARCPVLVLNKEIEAFKMEKFILPSSLDNSIIKVIDQIKQFVAFFKADLEVLYVNTPARFKTTEEIENSWRKFKGVHELSGFAKLNIYNDKTIKRGITKYAKSNDSDLILLTSRHSNKPLSVLHGDITEHLVNHDDFPVLAFNLKMANRY